MDSYSLHLAMAALFGASFVAVSAYYMHRKTLNQLLEFAKSIERERADFAAEDGAADDAADQLKRYPSRRRRKANGGYNRRASASLPDVTTFSGGAGEGDEKRNGPVRVDSIPAGLPRLHTLPEGMRM